MIRLVGLCWVCLVSGCGSFLLPFDERPLPAPHSLETVSGERIDLDREGRLIVRPERGDIGLALGVGLSEEEGGVVVTHRLRPGTELLPGDRILTVWARVPPAKKVAQAFLNSARGAFSESTEQVLTSLGEAFDERKIVLSGAELDQTPRQTVITTLGSPDLAPISTATLGERGHAVGSLEDLRGYASAGAWLTLDVLVLRAGEEVAVRTKLSQEPQPLFVRSWSPSLTRFQGIEVVPVAELDAGLWPLHAKRDDVLVARVARDAPTARAGLRPLDLVAADDVTELLAGRAVEVRKPNGSHAHVHAEPRTLPVEIWVPLLFTYQDNGVRTHLGVGPWDTTFHYSKRVDYEPISDGYSERWRWSLGTSIQNSGLSGPTGTVHSGGVSLLMDSVRMDYLNDVWNADLEAQTRGAGVAQ